jgi:hypothetical protein
MPEVKPKLFIVEDVLDLSDMLSAYFRVEGTVKYLQRTASSWC